MYSHVNRKFPQHAAAIRGLARSDATVRGIVADYEEICTWLAVQDGSATPDLDELEHARKVIRDLEGEILTHLEDNDGN